MSVETFYEPIEEAGNGVKVAFDFAFKILAATDLVVRKKLANGTYTDPLTLDADYSVAFDSDAETGTVTYVVAPVTGGASNIQRSSNYQQASTYKLEGTFPAKTTENALDKLTLLVQELQEKFELAPQIPAVPVAVSIIIDVPPVDGQYLQWSGPDTNGAWHIISATAPTPVVPYYSYGLFANRPVAPATIWDYYSTDKDQYDRWIPQANRWFTLG